MGTVQKANQTPRAVSKNQNSTINIRSQDYRTNYEVLEKANLPSMEATLMLRQ